MVQNNLSLLHIFTYCHNTKRLFTNCGQCLLCDCSIMKQWNKRLFIRSSNDSPFNRLCIWWRTQSPARDSGSGWGHPTSVCHHSVDTDDKMTNGSVFFLCSTFDNCTQYTDVFCSVFFLCRAFNNWTQNVDVFCMSSVEISRKLSTYAFISTYSNISRGKLRIPWKQKWLQWNC